MNSKQKALIFLKKSEGFTLVELLVVITVIVILSIAGILALDIGKQQERARDSRRVNDMSQVRNAVELYYHDHECYPTQLAFGYPFTEANVVYMEKLPQDAKCSTDNKSCYLYVTEASSCPQWYAVFTNLAEKKTVSTCPLSTLSQCVPSFYSANQYACQLGGEVDCGAIYSSAPANPSQVSAPPNIPGGQQTVESTPTVVQPTPTPVPCPDGPWYACRGGHCNNVTSVDPGETYYCAPGCSGVCL